MRRARRQHSQSTENGGGPSVQNQVAPTGTPAQRHQGKPKATHHKGEAEPEGDRPPPPCDEQGGNTTIVRGQRARESGGSVHGRRPKYPGRRACTRTPLAKNEWGGRPERCITFSQHKADGQCMPPMALCTHTLALTAHGFNAGGGGRRGHRRRRQP